MIRRLFFIKKKSWLLILLILFSNSISATRRYVMPGSAGTAPYTSWATASNDLQAVINVSVSNDEIWVAAGTYLPNRRMDATGTITINDRNDAFVLVAGVKIYGGFTGGETLLSSRDYTLNVTRLSGDIGSLLATNNCYHVVVAAGAGGSGLLDGFTIKNGYGDLNTGLTVNGQVIPGSRGAGIYIGTSSPTIQNCIITSNSALNGVNVGGAGIYASAFAAPVITNCVISNNNTTNGTGSNTYGGGMYIASTTATITDCIFSGNSSATEGGGIYIATSAAPTITNCSFIGNTATTNGGGMFTIAAPSANITNCLFSGNIATSGSGIYNSSSACTFSNCTITANKATTAGGGMFNNTSAPIIKNCIIYGNTAPSGTAFNNTSATVSYSIVEGGYAGGTNIITTSPLFVNPLTAGLSTAGDYRLQKCSPAVNAGNNIAISASITTDLDDDNRIVYTTVDIGCYEYNSFTSTTLPDINGIVYVDAAKSGNGSSWNSAVSELSDALLAAKYNSDIREIWVAKGTYKPIYNASDSSNQFCTSTSRDNAFVLVNNVKVYGGFAGGETNISQRNISTNTTTLSGDIGVANDNTDNCYHIVISPGAIGTAALDGFTIIKANANGIDSIAVNSLLISHNCGAGMYNMNSSPGMSNCIFSDNVADISGGGLHNNSFSSPIITTCSFKNNSATYGGGMDNYLSSSPTITNCIFMGNSAPNGGGMNNSYSSSLTITNCTFTGNSATYGGGISNYSSDVTSSIINCTISGNKATSSGGGIYTTGGTQIIKNSIVWGNKVGAAQSNVAAGLATISYSLIEGGYAGTNNININPLFVNAQSASAAPTIAGDYRLQSCSPAINIGNNANVPGSVTTDLDGNQRIFNTTVDMGAYELQTEITSFWKGINLHWNDPQNWCGNAVPTATTNVLIPNSVVIYPTIEDTRAVKNISFQSGTSLTLLSTGKLTINGTYTNNGCTITNNGDWVMSGNTTSQTFPGTSATVSAMKNLEINNTNGITFNKSFELTGTLTPTSGNINVNNATLTLNSDATSTARVAQIQSGASFSYTGTGKFEIERYIPARRAWRLLTAPISTTTNPTISQSWQEGLSNSNRLIPNVGTSGFGTTITKSTTYNAADGYDQGSTNNPSIKYFTGALWNGTPSKTNGTTLGANNGLINDQQGYMLFVRGDRSIQVSNTWVTPTVTTLRPKGQLKVGPQPINCTGWTVIGNPYASPINFHKIVLDNPALSDAFYVWDANLAGNYNVGGWVSYGAYNGTSQTYTVAPSLPGNTFANNKGDISSGSAFMVHHTGAITINENHKSTLGDNVLYRPIRQLSINLYEVNADASQVLNDGAVVLMNELPLAASAEKNRNFTENLSIAYDNKFYAILNRQRPNLNDTIFVNIGQMKQKKYSLELKSDELNLPESMKAFLEDTYLNTKTIIDLLGTTTIDFIVLEDIASANANRFRIIFSEIAEGPLPVTITTIQASVLNENILVEWQTANEVNIRHYEVERSTDGINFIKIANVATQPNSYSLLDENIFSAPVYYRIKSVDVNGASKYSKIIKVTKDNQFTKSLIVYPNPVTGNKLQLQLNKQISGNYKAILFNNIGQKIFEQQWQHNGDFVNKTFDLPQSISTGMYQLEIIKPSRKKETIIINVPQ